MEQRMQTPHYYDSKFLEIMTPLTTGFWTLVGPRCGNAQFAAQPFVRGSYEDPRGKTVKKNNKINFPLFFLVFSSQKPSRFFGPAERTR